MYNLVMNFTKREQIIIPYLTYKQSKDIEELFSELFPLDLETSIISKIKEETL